MSRRMIWGVLILVLIVLLSGALAVVAYAAYACPARFREGMPSTIQPDPELGYTLRPNLAVTMPVGNGRIRIYTNAQGIRTAGPGAGQIERAQIVVLGDSQTFGYVAYEDSYPALLGKTLGVTVANLGVSGYGPVSAIRRYERFADLKPRVVVLGFYYDSLERSLSACYPGFTFSCMSMPHVVVDRDGTLRIMEPRDNTAVIETLRARLEHVTAPRFPLVFSRDFCWNLRMRIVGYVQPGGLLDFHRRDRDPSHMVQAAKFLLGRLKEHVTQHGGRLVILYIPNYFGAKVVGPSTYLVETARELGVPFVDLTPTLQAAKARAGAAIMIPGDGHLSPWANSLVVDLLANEIHRDRLLAP